MTPDRLAEIEDWMSPTDLPPWWEMTTSGSRVADVVIRELLAEVNDLKELLASKCPQHDEHVEQLLVTPPLKLWCGICGYTKELVDG